MGRKQLIDGFYPSWYLADLLRPPYRGETGFTPEDALIKFLTHLEETNEVCFVPDDAIWTIGAYLDNGNRRDTMLRIRWYTGSLSAVPFEDLILDASIFDVRVPEFRTDTAVRLQR